MPSNTLPTIWEADEHTKAKIEILKGYLWVFFEIMGRKMHGQDLFCVDGFAGPGHYTKYPE